jgi:hypothetical protein
VLRTFSAVDDHVFRKTTRAAFGALIGLPLSSKNACEQWVAKTGDRRTQTRAYSIVSTSTRSNCYTATNCTQNNDECNNAGSNSHRHHSNLQSRFLSGRRTSMYTSLKCEHRQHCDAQCIFHLNNSHLFTLVAREAKIAKATIQPDTITMATARRICISTGWILQLMISVVSLSSHNNSENCKENHIV